MCYDRYRLSCKSGNQCVLKGDICHGASQCQDGSDVAACSPDNDDDICPPRYYYSKCSTDFPTDHQECYYSDRDKDSQKFDCINRGDKTITNTEKELVDYESITSCVNSMGSDGLMCGAECWWVGA